VQLRSVRELAEELDQLRRAYAHGHEQERPGADHTAWRRALDLFGGLEE